jgi:hypothetical protein
VQQRWMAALAAPLVIAVLLVGTAGAGGVSGPGFYVAGELYRTVGTPTDLSGTGAPDHSYDTIYEFDGAQMYNVADAAPGDPDYNGGRWMVMLVTFTNDYATALAAYDANMSGDFDTAAEVEAAVAGGAIQLELVKQFECPAIPLPRNAT